VVAVGQRHSLALRSDGAVMAWGDNGVGQCDVPDNLRGVAIAGGGLFSVAVKRNRTVAAWGDDFLGQCQPPDGLQDVVAVAAGSHHALALRTDGTVVAWGDNSCGQCDIPAGLTGVSAITAAATYSLALKADGTVVAWGQPATVQPAADLTNVVAIAAGDDSALALVDAEGPFLVRAIGDLDAVLGAEITLTAAVHGSAPLVFQWYEGVQPLADSERISGTATQNLVIQEARLEDTGEYSLLARNAGGIVVTPAARLTVFAAPRIEKQPESLSSSLGSEALLSASADGAGPLAYQWFKDGTALIDNERVSGAGLQQLRIGSLVFGDAGEYSVAVSNAHGSVISRVAQVTVTQVAGWGENWCGELDVPADLTGVIKLAAGGAHALALREDGTMIAWGDNLHGQCDVPEDLNDAVAIAAGGFHSLALRRNGNVVGWGYSKGGLLDVPPGLDSVTAIAAGMGHSIALRGDGTVRCWGLKDPLNAELAADLREIVGIAAGGRHSIALRSNGTVFLWGGSDFLDPPPGLNNVIAVAAGAYHSLAFRSDGTMVGWGSKRYLSGFLASDLVDLPSLASKLKQPDRPVDIWLASKLSAAAQAALAEYQGQGSDPVPLQDALCMSLNGLVWYSSVYDPQRFSGVALRSETKMLLAADPSGGDFFLLNRLLLEDAYPVELARNSSPSRVPEGLSNVVQIAAGPSFSAALKGDGTAVAWGSNHSDESRPPPGLHNVVAIAAGGGYGLALRGNGRPFILGQSVSRKAVLGEQVMLQASLSGTAPLACAWLKDGLPMSDGSGISGARESTLDIAQVSYADEGVYTLTVSNELGSATSGPITLSVIQVLGWGDDAFGQVDAPRGTRDVAALASGDSHTLALHTDGSISAWGEGGDGQTDTPHEIAVAIATGGFHNLALRPDGTVMAWGRNRAGQCDVPPDLADVVAIAAGRAHSIALRADGNVVGWGRTVIPPGVQHVAAIAAGAYHSLALRDDGEVVAWGQNSVGQCSSPADLRGVIRIAAGGYHSLAIKQDGTVVAWGTSDAGESRVPPNLTDVVAIAAGDHHSAALQADGSVVSWGLNQSGQCNTPSTPLKFTAIAAGRVHNLAVVSTERLELLRPVLVEAVAGGAVRLSAYALGRQPITYQWFRDGQPLMDNGGTAGSRTATLLLHQAAALPGLYSLWAMNAFGELWSEPVDLSAALGPRIRLQPQAREVLQGTKVVLTAEVEGPPPIALQWLAGGVPLGPLDGVTGFDTPVLEIGTVEASHAGIYRLTATNAYGGTMSAAVDLSVSNVRAWGDNRYGQSLLPYPFRGIKAISALADHLLLLRWDGTVEAWGANSRKQCEVPVGLSNVVGIAAGRDHSMVLKADGTVLGWGGFLERVHVAPPGVTNIAAIASGSEHCYALRGDGRILWWQAGMSQTISDEPSLFSYDPLTGGTIRSMLAQQSDSPALPRTLGAFIDIAPGLRFYHSVTRNGRVEWWTLANTSPVQPLDSLTNVIAITAGLGDSCLALLANGSVSSWTAGKTGSVALIEPFTAAVAVAAARDVHIALTEAGDVLGWGAAAFPRAGLNDVVGLSAGQRYSLAVRADGQVVAWGAGASSGYKALRGLSNVVGVSAGFYGHNLALRQDGFVMAWGDNSYSQCEVPLTLRDVVAIAAGGRHSLALKTDGTVLAWGDNREGQCNVPVNIQGATGIAAGWYHSLALLSDGSVVGWGSNSSGQVSVPDDLSDVVAVEAGPGRSFALRRNGTLMAWGSLNVDLSAIWGWSNIVAVAAGAMHVVGLKGDGTVVIAGSNNYGQAEVPPELKHVTVIAAGDYHTMAAVGDGPVARALGDRSLRWRTDDELPWVAQMLVTQDGRLAAQSADLMPGEESWLETSVHGPGTLRFWWRTASANPEDALEVVLNGATVARATGNSEWEWGRLAVHSGSSTVRWRYIRAAASTPGTPAA